MVRLRWQNFLEQRWSSDPRGLWEIWGAVTTTERSHRHTHTRPDTSTYCMHQTVWSLLADTISWTADDHRECSHLNSAQMLSHLPARDEDPENLHQPAECSASCRIHDAESLCATVHASSDSRVTSCLFNRTMKRVQLFKLYLQAALQPAASLG